MDNQNRVVVKIYGQEYTISGDQPSEHIMRIAEYVDGKMTELAKSLPGVPAASVAALSAVNIADDYFASIKIANELRAQMAQLEKDKNQFAELFEEAKKNYIQYKEEARALAAQLEENARHQESCQDSSAAAVSELEAKYKEMENSFFDLQMENIQLKGELERYKKIVD